MNATSRLFTLAQLARRLGVTTEWLRSEAAAGKLPHVHAAGRFLFDPEVIERMLLERAQELPSTPEENA